MCVITSCLHYKCESGSSYKKVPNIACMSAVRDFMGLRSDKLQIYDVPSGINVVPLTIAEPSGYSEEASLAAGVTGYKV